MREVVWAKFSQNPHLGAKLLASGARYIEETNWWGDWFFGKCRGKGLNVLGDSLMETRGRLGGVGVVPAPTTPEVPHSQLSLL